MTRPNRAPSDRHKAVTLICKSIPNLDDAAIKKMLCASVGHPPVVKNCFGQLTCARCSEVVGDLLMGVAPKDKMVVGHDDPECAAISAKLTPTDKLMTNMAVAV